MLSSQYSYLFLKEDPIYAGIKEVQDKEQADYSEDLKVIWSNGEETTETFKFSGIIGDGDNMLDPDYSSMDSNKRSNEKNVQKLNAVKKKVKVITHKISDYQFTEPAVVTFETVKDVNYSGAQFELTYDDGKAETITSENITFSPVEIADRAEYPAKAEVTAKVGDMLKGIFTVTILGKDAESGDPTTPIEDPTEQGGEPTEYGREPTEPGADQMGEEKADSEQSNKSTDQNEGNKGEDNEPVRQGEEAANAGNANISGSNVNSIQPPEVKKASGQTAKATGTVSQASETGDMNYTALWITLSVTAGAIAAFAIIGYNRKKKET